MNWSSVKNLLIFILVAANLFLVFNIVRQDRSRKYLSVEEVIGAAELLSERGLEVPLECVPLQKFNASVYESKYNDEYYTEVAKALTDSPRDLLLSLPDGGFSITAVNGATMEFDNEFGFFYARQDTFKDMAYTDITAENFAVSAEIGEELRGSLKKELSKKTMSFLSTRFPSDYDLKAEVTNSYVDPITGLNYLLALQKLDGCDVYSHYAVCVFDGGELIGAYGRWFFSGFDKTHSAELVDQVNILFSDLATLKSDFLSSFALTDDADAQTPSPFDADLDGAKLPKVASIKACYATYWNADKTALYFIPAWQIDHVDGQIIVYNATNGAVYSRNK